MESDPFIEQNDSEQAAPQTVDTEGAAVSETLSPKPQTQKEFRATERNVDVSHLLESYTGDVSITMRLEKRDVAILKVAEKHTGVHVDIDNAIGIMTIKGTDAAVKQMLQEIKIIPSGPQTFMVMIDIESAKGVEQQKLIMNFQQESGLHVKQFVKNTDANGRSNIEQLRDQEIDRQDIDTIARRGFGEEDTVKRVTKAFEGEQDEDVISLIEIDTTPVNSSVSTVVTTSTSTDSTDTTTTDISSSDTLLDSETTDEETTTTETPSGGGGGVPAPPNNSPVVASALADQAATEAALFGFTFGAADFTDPDADPLTYSALLNGGGALPAWLSFNAATRSFSGTPAGGDVGTISVDVTADDGNGGTVVDTFDIVVGAANAAPVVATPLVNQAINEDSALNYTYGAGSFTDADADPLTYTATLVGGGALPSWLTFDGATRNFSGTPLNADVGTISVRVTADDGNGGTVTDDFDIVTSNINDAPVVDNALLDQSGIVGNPINYAFDAGSFDDDDIVHGDSLTYTATLSDGSALPAWLTFTAATRTFSGTPPATGTTSVRVTATDGSAESVTDDFDINITNTLVVTGLSQINGYTEDVALDPTDIVITVAPAATATVTMTMSDPNAGRLTTAISNAVTSTYDVTTGVWTATGVLADVNAVLALLEFDPDEDYNDDFTIAVSVTSGAETLTGTWVMNGTEVNDNPYVASSLEGYVLTTADNSYAFTIPADLFSDVDIPDGDSITDYQAEFWNGAAWTTVMPAYITYDGDRSFTVDGALAGEIAIDMRMTATDSNAGTGTWEWFIGVGATFLGTAGNDNGTLDGTAGDDTIIALDGDDIVDEPDGGDDAVFGGGGNDNISDTVGGADTLLGDDGNDSIAGGVGNDEIYGSFGADTLLGEANDDRIYGEQDDDSLDGGSGDDIVHGGQGNDYILSGIGNDTLFGGYGDDYIRTDSGNATVDGGYGDDTFESGEGQETYTGGSGDNWYYFLNNTVSEVAFTDVITDFDQGRDKMLVVGYDNVSYSAVAGVGSNLTYFFDGGGNTIIHNANGFGIQLTGEIFLTDDDFFLVSYIDVDNNDDNNGGTGGIDGILGMDGDDTYDGGAGNDLIWGGTGDDSISGGTGSDRMWGELGNDTINAGGSSTNNTLDGGAGDDRLEGSTTSTGRDSMLGGVGNDYILVSGGADTVYGGDGNDSVYSRDGQFDSSLINLGDGDNEIISTSATSNSSTITSGSGNDSMSFQQTSYSTVQAGGGDDTIFIAVDATGSSIDGGAGNDSIQMGIGHFGTNYNSTVYGGVGDDTIEVEGSANVYGGDGNDTFVYRNSLQSRKDPINYFNRIRDYDQGDDTIDLSGLGYTGIAAGAAVGSILGWTQTTSYGDNVTLITGSTFTSNQNFQLMLYGHWNLVAGDFIFTDHTAGNGVTGTAGADVIGAVAGDFEILGLGGDDDITFGNGRQFAHGDTGNDSVDGTGTTGEKGIWGGDGNDTLRGGEDVDLIMGNDDDDSLFGNGGNDSIEGDDGNDSLEGGSGSDTLLSGAGTDTLRGGDDGDQIFTTGSTNSEAYGDAGNDSLYARGDNDTLRGGTGNDTVYLSSETGFTHTIFGEDGTDIFALTFDTTTIFGGNDSDTFQILGIGDHELSGDGGNDLYFFDYNSILAGRIDDIYVDQDTKDIKVMDFTNGADTFDLDDFAFTSINIGAAKDDTLGASFDGTWTNVTDEFGDFGFRINGDVTALLNAPDFDFNLADIDVGTGAGDVLNVLNGRHVVGGAGNDTITHAGEGNVIGGNGDDEITMTTTSTAREIVVNAGDGNDTINGSDVNNATMYEILRGGDGNDEINARRGADWIHGGDGEDTLSGGTDAHTDYFEYKNTGESQTGTADLITDFTDSDFIDLRAIGTFSALAEFTVVFAAGTTTMTDNTFATGFEITFTGDVTGFLDDTDILF